MRSGKPKLSQARFGPSVVLSIIVALLLGGISWHVVSAIQGSPIFNPDFGAMQIWLIGSAFVAALINSKNFLSIWLSLYTGVYLINLPFMPSDPLVPLGMVLGFFTTALYCFIGNAFAKLIK